jgi:hypothetical protein
MVRAVLTNVPNFCAVSNAAKILLKHTPLSNERNSKFSLLLICREQQRTFSDQIVSGSIRDRSLEFPNFAADFVNKG